MADNIFLSITLPTKQKQTIFYCLCVYLIVTPLSPCHGLVTRPRHVHFLCRLPALPPLGCKILFRSMDQLLMQWINCESRDKKKYCRDQRTRAVEIYRICSSFMPWSSTATRPNLARNMPEIVCDDVSWLICGKSGKIGTRSAQKKWVFTPEKRQGRHKGRDVVCKMFRERLLQDAVCSSGFAAVVLPAAWAARVLQSLSQPLCTSRGDKPVSWVHLQMEMISKPRKYSLRAASTHRSLSFFA